MPCCIVQVWYHTVVYQGMVWRCSCSYYIILYYQVGPLFHWGSTSSLVEHLQFPHLSSCLQWHIPVGCFQFQWVVSELFSVQKAWFATCICTITQFQVETCMSVHAPAALVCESLNISSLWLSVSTCELEQLKTRTWPIFLCLNMKLSPSYSKCRTVLFAIAWL